MDNTENSILTAIETTKSLNKGKYYLLVVNLPFGKFSNVNYFEVNNNTGKAFLSDRTTSKDAENGFTRLGLTGKGHNCPIIDINNVKEQRMLEIERYLNSRFNSDWTITLEPVKI